MGSLELALGGGLRFPTSRTPPLLATIVTWNNLWPKAAQSEAELKIRKAVLRAGKVKRGELLAEVSQVNDSFEGNRSPLVQFKPSCLLL